MNVLMKPRALPWAALIIASVFAVAGCSKKNVREPAELKSIAKPALSLKTVWSASAGSGSDKYYGGLTLSVAPDAIYAGDVDGRLYAFDPKTGKRIWQASTGQRVIAGPVPIADTVVAGTMDGQVVAVKRADGSKLWTTRLSSEALSPPAGDGDRVVMRSGDGRIYGLNTATGAEVWSLERSVPNLTLRGLSPAAVLGTRAYIGLDNGRILALRSSDGQALWEQVVAAPVGRNELERITDIDAPLLADGGDLYVASFGGEVACLDDETGQILWRRSIKSYTGLARAEAAVAVSDDTGVLWGLDPTTGAELWKNEELKYRQLSAPAVFGGYIVAGDYKGYLHWFDPKDGKIVARTKAGGDAIRVAPVVGGDSLYVLSSGGRVTAIRVR